MAIKVVCAGLGRTGTNSLKLALEQLLGAPCYHMYEVGKHPEHPAIWTSAYNGELPDWDVLFEGYAAAVDWPAAPFWEPISAVYPEALIMLSVRDADSWWASASQTIFHHMNTMFAAEGPGDDWSAMFAAMMARFTPDWRDETAAKAAYEAYNESVRRSAPPQRFLEWHAGDGWEPICERLGLPVPGEPFPHTNTREDMRAMLGIVDDQPG